MGRAYFMWLIASVICEYRGLLFPSTKNACLNKLLLFILGLINFSAFRNLERFLIGFFCLSPQITDRVNFGRRYQPRSIVATQVSYF